MFLHSIAFIVFDVVYSSKIPLLLFSFFFRCLILFYFFFVSCAIRQFAFSANKNLWISRFEDLTLWHLVHPQKIAAHCFLLSYAVLFCAHNRFLPLPSSAYSSFILSLPSCMSFRKMWIFWWVAKVLRTVCIVYLYCVTKAAFPGVRNYICVLPWYRWYFLRYRCHHIFWVCFRVEAYTSYNRST